MTELQISYFLEVAKQFSYTKAAQELHITQPSISYQIKTLETELGFQLFNRSGKNKLTMTPSGSLFLEQIQKMEAEFHETLLRALELADKKTLAIRIGLSEAWDLFPLVTTTNLAIKRQYPGAKITFETNSFKELKQRLLSNDLDVILCVQTCLTNFDGIAVEPVQETRATLYYSGNRKHTEGTKLSLSDFEKEPYYVLPEDETPLSRDRHHAYILSNMVRPKIIEMPNRDSILLAISGGVGYCIFDSWSRYKKQSGMLTLPLDFTIPVCAVKKESNHNPLIDIFIQQARGM